VVAAFFFGMVVGFWFLIFDVHLISLLVFEISLRSGFSFVMFVVNVGWWEHQPKIKS
jgi:hypothetical protein